MFIQFSEKFTNRTVTLNSDYIVRINQSYITEGRNTVPHDLVAFKWTTSFWWSNSINSTEHYELTDSDYERITKQLLSL